MLSHLKDILIGPALPTQTTSHKGLNKVRALAAFSPVPWLRSAYANQEIYLGLVVAGAAGLAYGLPISIAIASLLGIVALSYYQTIHAYPGGVGAYIVARDNLGELPAQTAGAALLTDYILTVLYILSKML